MPKLCSVILILGVAAWLSGCGSSAQPATSSPLPSIKPQRSGAKESMERFRAVLKGEDVNTVMWMLDNIDPSIPAAASQRDRMRNLSRRMVQDGYDFKVLEAKEMGDCAVAIIRDNQNRGAADYSPVYLVQRGGRWLVSPSLSTWDQMGRLTKGQLDRFKELKYWYEIRKAEYKVILGRKKPSH